MSDPVAERDMSDSLIAIEREPTQEEELAAITTMVAYLLPQARKLSPSLAMYLGLALHELSLLRAIDDGVVVRLQS
ncbi:hypothetical protein ACWIGM_03370 [Bosea sp. NPDC055332]